MKKIFKKRFSKVGTPPGSLIYTGELKASSSQIALFLYDSDTIVEKDLHDIHEALRLCQNGKRIWLHITGINDASLIHSIGMHFKLHPLMLEDIMSPTQRSKLDDYKNYIYIATHVLSLKGKGLEDEQLSLVIGSNVLLTFAEKPSDILKPIKDRLLKASSRMRQRGPDYLAYSILDCIVDNYFLILEKIDENLESLESHLLQGANSKITTQIQSQKRELVLVRKAIWPMREVISQFSRVDSHLITETTRLYIHDVYDHSIQAIEALETFRDFIGGMHDIYLSNINQKMNETIKVLTVVSTIFVPLTFITSLYGMNFDNMPELHYSWGYPIVLLTMVFITCLMLYIFRKKNWL